MVLSFCRLLLNIFVFFLFSESESSVIEDEQVEENENSAHTDEESEEEEEGSNVNEEEEQEESEEMEDDGQDSGLERKDNRPTDQNGMADSTVRCVLYLLSRFFQLSLFYLNYRFTLYFYFYFTGFRQSVLLLGPFVMRLGQEMKWRLTLTLKVKFFRSWRKLVKKFSLFPFDWEGLSKDFMTPLAMCHVKSGIHLSVIKTGFVPF